MEGTWFVNWWCRRLFEATEKQLFPPPHTHTHMPSYWTRLEMFCRDLTNVYDEVRVVSGPLFLLEEDNTTGKSLVKYEVGIATNSVTHRCLHARVISKHCILISQGPDAKTRGMPSDQLKHIQTTVYSVQYTLPQLHIKCGVVKSCPGTHTALQVPMVLPISFPLCHFRKVTEELFPLMARGGAN